MGYLRDAVAAISIKVVIVRFLQFFLQYVLYGTAVVSPATIRLVLVAMSTSAEHPAKPGVGLVRQSVVT